MSCIIIQQVSYKCGHVRWIKNFIRQCVWLIFFALCYNMLLMNLVFSWINCSLNKMQVNADTHTSINSGYSQHLLIQPLVIQTLRLIRPFSLDIHHWLFMSSTTLNATPCRIQPKIFVYFLVELTGADYIYRISSKYGTPLFLGSPNILHQNGLYVSSWNIFIKTPHYGNLQTNGTLNMDHHDTIYALP